MSLELLLATFVWLSLAAAAYVYLVFPALAALVPPRRRPVASASGSSDGPPITVIVPAHNEERNIAARISNLLGADYPRELLDIIVVSDASTDRTDQIAASFAADGVRLLVQPTRRGKTAGLNAAVLMARADIIVFTDANASYPPGTLRALYDELRDPRVGLVTGYTRYRTTEAGRVAEVTNVYTAIERVIKRAESRWGCCVGADGAVFAMRGSLYRPLRDDDINDFVLPLAVIEQGYDCVFAPEVFCAESAAKEMDGEFRRQSRITNRTLRALWRHLRLLDPRRFPRFAFFLLSHKVVRFLVPPLLLVSSACLPFLMRRGPMYPAIAVAGLVAVLLAALGATTVGARRLGRPARVLSALFTVNLAILNGWQRFLRGQRDVTWQHDRSTAPAVGAAAVPPPSRP